MKIQSVETSALFKHDLFLQLQKKHFFQTSHSWEISVLFPNNFTVSTNKDNSKKKCSFGSDKTTWKS